MIIGYVRSFDGVAFTGPGRVEVTGDRIARVLAPEDPATTDLTCRFLMPGLIDAHAAVYGYAERPPDTDPFAPHRAALDLHLRLGVTTVRDPGNSLEAIAYLRSLGGPTLLASGPVLDGPPLSRLAARLVRDETEANHVVHLHAADGADLISLGRYLDPPCVVAAVAAARDNGLTVAIDPGRTDVAQAAAVGVTTIEYLPRLAGVDAPPLDQLLAWADPATKAETDRLLDALAAAGTGICPLLAAQRRRVLLKEAVNEPALDDMVPIMPYHRHLKAMRGSVGYAIGRRMLNEYLPMPTLDRAQTDTLARAFDAIGAWLLAARERGVPVLAGSGSPGLAAIPGHGLYGELQRLVSAGFDTAAALAAATSVPARVLGLADRGRIAPRARADLVLVDTDPGEAPGALAHTTRRVLVGGRLAEGTA